MVSFLLGAIANTWPFMKNTTKDKFGADDRIAPNDANYETLAHLEREQCALLAPGPAQRAEVLVDAGGNKGRVQLLAAPYQCGKMARCGQKHNSVF